VTSWRLKADRHVRRPSASISRGSGRSGGDRLPPHMRSQPERRGGLRSSSRVSFFHLPSGFGRPLYAPRRRALARKGSASRHGCAEGLSMHVHPGSGAPLLPSDVTQQQMVCDLDGQFGCGRSKFDYPPPRATISALRTLPPQAELARATPPRGAAVGSSRSPRRSPSNS
jgi:hypothetical protein